MRLRSISLAAAPVTEPVSLAEALRFFRVDDTDELPLIAGLIATAREVVELYTGRSLISTQWLLMLPSWESGYAENYANNYLTSASGGYPALNALALFSNARRESQDIVFLDRSPLLTVDAVKYYDTTETLATLASSNYYTLGAGAVDQPGAIALKSSASWPALFDRPDAVQIAFTAGVARAALVPQNLRTAVLILAKHYYDAGRELVDVAQAVKEIPLGARHMMESRRVEGWVS